MKKIGSQVQSVASIIVPISYLFDYHKNMKIPTAAYVIKADSGLFANLGK
jgi:hypothetical protein